MKFIANPRHFSKRLLQLCIVFAISTCSGLAISAEVYKWADSNGNIHYSDKKPNNTTSESIKIQNASSSQRASVQSQAKALDEKAARAMQAKQDAALEDARKKEIEDKCATIRENLKIIAETSRIRVLEDGTPRYLNPEEIEAKKARHEEQIKEFCQ